MQWSFSNKSSAVPQLLSFQGSQEDNKKHKTGFDSLASTGLVTLTTREAFDSDHKSYAAAQKNNVHEKQGGVRYTMTTHPIKRVDTHAIHQTNITMSPAVHQSYAAHNNLIGSVISQPLAGIPISNPVLVTMPSTNPIVGSTDSRNGSKISGAPAQLTIFYNGSVCVYEHISPEKAQAIMLLAGNGPPTASCATPPAAAVQAKVARSSVLEGTSRPQHCSPVPITSITVSHSAASRPGSSNAAKPAGVVGPTTKIVTSLGSLSTAFLSSDTVPQFRRKSLARFLEKRKERVIGASPYGDKPSPDCSTPGAAAGSRSLSVNSSGSCPVPAIN